MNVLIVDPSVVPDIEYQQRIVQQLGSAADNCVRLATGVLQAAWQTREFGPDVIVFDRIDDCDQLRKLIAMLRGIHPGVAMFHLDDGGCIATENPCADAAPSVVPHWLRDMAAYWFLVRSASIPALSQWSAA